MQSFDYQNRMRIVFGEGALEHLGGLARELGFRRTLVVADRGLAACGYVEEATRQLGREGIAFFAFHEFHVNPDSLMVEAGREFAASLDVDSIIGLGGGSSMDCAKAINFVLTNGGAIADYWGYGKAARPMLPMIGIPTTAGTGSEAQSYALISDAKTHLKMACGDPKAAFQVAILDPRLTVSQPRLITATAGFDAISHAVETYVTTRRTALSEMFSREAWRLLEANYEVVLERPEDIGARGAMQLGAFYAGLAIENSMLGATHACANPLTARYGTAHGDAVALMLPRVVRWNSRVVADRYGELVRSSSKAVAGEDSGEALATRLEQMIEAGCLPRRLSQLDISEQDIAGLAEEAGAQWTGRFNPRPFGALEAMEVYRCAY
jgi:alcohol dehydrogenase